MGIGTALATSFAAEGATAATIAASATAINVGLAVGAAGIGMSVYQSKQAKKAASKQKKAAAAATAANKDKLVITPKGIAQKNARTSLIVGSVKGPLATEDKSATSTTPGTSGRGTLLGN